MLAAYLAGITVAFNQSKVPPVMQALIEQLNVDLATGGWLMSSFAVAGVILGIPAAFSLRLLGPKGAGLAALGCTILGSVAGALSISPAMLLAGRVVEGIGLGLITVVAPTIISLWFSPAERGLPMGLWASWVPVGSFLVYNLAGPLLEAFGWQGIWWCGALFALAAFVIYAGVVSAPPGVRAAAEPPAAPGGWLGRPLLNPAPWLVAVVFGSFVFATSAFSTWAPSYFTEAFRLDPEAASFQASLLSLAVIPSAIIAGRVLDRVRNRYLVLTLAVLIVGLLLPWSFQLGFPALIAPYMLGLGLVVGFIPTALFTLAPETVGRVEHAGLALGILSVGQNLGMLLGPPVVAAYVAGHDWRAGIPPMLVSMAFGLAASLWLQFGRPERRLAPSQI
jgi:MFS family permease